MEKEEEREEGEEEIDILEKSRESRGLLIFELTDQMIRNTEEISHTYRVNFTNESIYYNKYTC